MGILNLKKGKRIRDQIRLVTQRIRCFIYVPKQQEPTTGFIFVSDLKDTSITAYISQSIRQGTEIQVAFEKKEAFGFRAKALVCNRMSLHQSFLGTPALNFLVTAQCTFSSEQERKQYEKFLEELKERYLFITKLVTQDDSKKAA